MKSAQLVQVKGTQMLTNCRRNWFKKSETVDRELTASATPTEPMFPPAPPREKKLKTKEPSMKAAAHITAGENELVLLDRP